MGPGEGNSCPTGIRGSLAERLPKKINRGRNGKQGGRGRTQMSGWKGEEEQLGEWKGGVFAYNRPTRN